MQNLTRLRGTKAKASGALVQGGATPEASVAFVQGGTTNPEDSNSMLSLGRMFYEPLWVFHRLPQDIERLTQLQGKRIAVGPPGSGTRALAMQLLGASEVSAANATFVDSPGSAAADALIAKEVDAAFFVSAPDAALVQKLLRTPGVRLMSFSQAEGYARRFPWLARIVLHKGVIDFAQRIPARDVELVAAVSLLAVRDDLHPALQFALAQAAAEVHRAPGIFNADNQFPQVQATELPMSAVAERFYKNGPQFFQRYLPFWIAVWMDRLIVLLVPLVAVLVPVFNFLPALYDWRVRKPLWRWYGDLRKLEAAMVENPGEHKLHVAEMQRIEEGVAALPLPVKYSEAHHNLRSYAEYVRRQLDAMATHTAAVSTAA